MIGVVCSPQEEKSAAEFFALFKTPWEFRRPGGCYHTILSTTGETPESSRNLTVLYAPQTSPQSSPLLAFSRNGRLRFPVYAPGAAPANSGTVPLLLAKEGNQAIAVADVAAGSPVIRAGFNPFRELELLFQEGQPEQFAGHPTLDAHISCLREWITGSGIPLVEIPPAPAGHPFTVCLTHDVDHPSLRKHPLDHTMWGYVLRATAGSLLEVFRGRRNLRYLARNLKAALSLPLVHLGWRRDDWRSFPDYLALDAPGTATFFVIPHAGDPGRGNGTQPSPHRASGYGAQDIRDELEQIAAAGGEIAVHGIDAWADPAAGKAERATLNSVAAAASQNRGGIRMHWLYADRETPARLEEAGYRYDSTFGYCTTVGYRAGTTQPFRPPGTSRLLELPLHIMDTALFYPAYLRLRQDEAANRIRPLIDHAQNAGGILTINWHDRSLFPERQWRDSYCELLRELRSRNPWMPSASDAADWFERRRSAAFESIPESGGIRIRARADSPPSGPAFRLRVHRPASASLNDNDGSGPAPFTDTGFSTEVETTFFT